MGGNLNIDYGGFGNAFMGMNHKNNNNNVTTNSIQGLHPMRVSSNKNLPLGEYIYK